MTRLFSPMRSLVLAAALACGVGAAACGSSHPLGGASHGTGGAGMGGLVGTGGTPGTGGQIGRTGTGGMPGTGGQVAGLGTGGTPGTGGQAGGSGGVTCSPDSRALTGCSLPYQGTCYHDPLPYVCDRLTGTWMCPLGTVPVPAINCGTGGGPACQQLPPLASGGTTGASGATASGGNGPGPSLGPAASYATGGPPANGVVVADFDGDGRPDLATTSDDPAGNGTSHVSVSKNEGDGTFGLPQLYASPDPAGYLAAADMNGDGKPDVVVAGRGSGTMFFLDVFLNDGQGGLAAPARVQADWSPVALALGDLDGDGHPDVVALVNGGSVNRFVAVWLNRGDGTLSPVRRYDAAANSVYLNPADIAIGDLDGDGRPDLAVVNYGTAVPGPSQDLSVFLNQGGGTFAPAVEYAAGAPVNELAVGDVDGDGDRDVVVSDGYSYLATLKNDGRATFASPVTISVGERITSFALADLTGRGHLDIVFMNPLAYGQGGWVGGNVGVLANDGTGAFAAPVNFPDKAESLNAKIAVADLNADSKPDIILPNLSYACKDTFSVLLNTSP